jgi:hypothetical protein
LHIIITNVSQNVSKLLINSRTRGHLLTFVPRANNSFIGMQMREHQIEFFNLKVVETLNQVEYLSRQSSSYKCLHSLHHSLSNTSILASTAIQTNNFNLTEVLFSIYLLTIGWNPSRSWCLNHQTCSSCWSFTSMPLAVNCDLGTLDVFDNLSIGTCIVKNWPTWQNVTIFPLKSNWLGL